jgi:hypothetical protein
MAIKLVEERVKVVGFKRRGGRWTLKFIKSDGRIVVWTCAKIMGSSQRS